MSNRNRTPCDTTWRDSGALEEAWRPWLGRIAYVKFDLPLSRWPWGGGNAWRTVIEDVQGRLIRMRAVGSSRPRWINVKLLLSVGEPGEYPDEGE